MAVTTGYLPHIWAKAWVIACWLVANFLQASFQTSLHQGRACELKPLFALLARSRYGQGAGTVKTLGQLAKGTMQRLAVIAAKSLPLPVGADIIEKLSKDMVTVVPIGEQSILFYTPTPLLRSRAASTLSKEIDMVRWIDTFEANSVFWDVGANVGTYSLYASIKRDVSVLAFEPSASNYHVLTKNIVINNLQRRANAYCLAFSGATELATMNLGSVELGSAINHFGKIGEMSPYWTGQGDVATHGMLGFTIDDFVERFRPPFPAYLKIDVDGLESRILEGAIGLLSDRRLRSVMVELSIVHAEERENTVARMNECDFRLVGEGESQWSGHEAAANHLFERS